MHKAVLILLGLTVLATTVLFVGQHLKKTQQASAEGVPANVYQQWLSFQRKYKKSYGAGEKDQRLAIFHSNFKKVQAHQMNKERTFDMEFNQYMDLTHEEFTSMYNTLRVADVQAELANNQISSLSTNALPTEVDWRGKGILTDVKDQGQCGSCWAFSTTGSVEAVQALKTKNVLSFSEQQLVDCSQSYGNYGCNGGLMTSGMKYIVEHGIALESEYPYTARDGACKKNAGDFKITGFTNIKQGDVAQLAAAVAIQPVSIAVDANNWQFYSKGVFSNCGTQLDHGVLLVGYTADYWIVRNSWANTWGEEGFIRLKRGNTCGISNMATYPTL